MKCGSADVLKILHYGREEFGRSFIGRFSGLNCPCRALAEVDSPPAPHGDPLVFLSVIGTGPFPHYPF